MKFSLVLCTINRVEENEIFLNSLLNQTYKNFELIIVDQNIDDRILPLIDYYKNHFDIIYLKSLPGLSKARNIGLEHISGEIISFPDDDCEYTNNILEGVYTFFSKMNYYNCVCSRQENSLINGIVLPRKKSKELCLKEAFTIGSISIFIKDIVFKDIGNFDEMLGLGANSPFLGGEDAELLIRAMKKGYHLYYDDNLVVRHPAIRMNLNTVDSAFLERYKKRFIGNGSADFYIYKKYFPLKDRLLLFINNTAMMIIHFLRNEPKLFRDHLYRIQGFWIAIKYFKSI